MNRENILIVAPIIKLDNRCEALTGGTSRGRWISGTVTELSYVIRRSGDKRAGGWCYRVTPDGNANSFRVYDGGIREPSK